MIGIGTDVLTRDYMDDQVERACQVAQSAGGDLWTLNLIRQFFGLPLIDQQYIHITSKLRSEAKAPDPLLEGLQEWDKDSYLHERDRIEKERRRKE